MAKKKMKKARDIESIMKIPRTKLRRDEVGAIALIVNSRGRLEPFDDGRKNLGFAATAHARACCSLGIERTKGGGEHIYTYGGHRTKGRAESWLANVTRR